MSFDILSVQELPKTLFVEASAGTGKTFLIEQYVVRLLLETATSIDSIVLVTFTKAVARELRKRLKKALLQVIEALECGTELFPYLLPYQRKERAERMTLCRRLDEAYERVPLATISTIHGLCDTLLQQFAIEEGKAETIAYISQEEQKAYIEEFVQRYDSLTANQWQRIARKFRRNEQLFIEELLSSLSEQSVEPCASDQLFFEGCQEVSNVSVESILLNVAPAFCGTSTRGGALKKEVYALCRYVGACVQQKKPIPCPAFISAASFTTYFEKKRAKGTGISEENFAVLQLCQTKIFPYILSQIDPERLVAKLKIDLHRSFYAYLRKSGKKTPFSSIQEVLSLVHTPSFVEMARKKYSCVIVDEFQDTDTDQWTILKTIFGAENIRMLCVGDPKQAIYGFRQADVYQYFHAKDQFPSESIQTLSVNYRATQAFVDAQNAIFCSGSMPSSWLFYLPQSKTSIDTIASTSNSKEVFSLSDDRCAIHGVIFSDSLGKKRKWPHEVLHDDQFLPWLCDEIIVLTEQGVSLCEIAILVKDRYQAKSVFQALSKRNIPAKTWKIDGISESSACVFIRNALLLAAIPEDREQLSKTLWSLSSNFFSEVLHTLSSGDLLTWASAVASWKTVREAFFSRGIGGFALALEQCCLDGTYLLADVFSSLDDGQQWRVDIAHIVELLGLIEQTTPPSLEAFAEKVVCFDQIFAHDPGSLVRRVNPEKIGVTIVTSHASKGLEFPYVFAVGIASRSMMRDTRCVVESDAEKMRLLYVSITRAKKRCYIPFFLEKDGKIPSFGQASPIELLAAATRQKTEPDQRWHTVLYMEEPRKNMEALCQSLKTTHPTLFSFSEGICEIKGGYYSYLEQSNVPEKEFLPLMADIPKKRSFSSSMSKKPKIAFIEKKGFGADFGTRFHEAIAICLKDSRARTSVDSIAEILKGYSWASCIPVERIVYALTTPMPLGFKEKSLLEIPIHQRRVEVPFWDKTAEGIIETGVIDVLVQHEGGVTVIDWKTNVVENSCETVFFDHEYDLQANMYLKAVQRAFPNAAVSSIFVFIQKLPEGGIVVYP